MISERLHGARYLLKMAEEARASADQAVLDNVRERCLRSEAAWLEMARRAHKAETIREDLAARKADGAAE